MEEFDELLKETVGGNKMSASRIKKLTALALAHSRDPVHIVSMLYKVQRKSPPANKLVAFYVTDSIARAAFELSKKESGASDKTASSSSHSAGGTLLRKLSSAVEELVEDIISHGLPEHKEKVRKVVDIWSRSGTLSSSMLSRVRQRHFSTEGAREAPTEQANGHIRSNSQATVASPLLGQDQATSAAAQGQGSPIVPSHQGTSAMTTTIPQPQTLGAPKTAGDLLALLAAHVASRSATDSSATNGANGTPTSAATQLALLQNLSAMAAAQQKTNVRDESAPTVAIAAASDTSTNSPRRRMASSEATSTSNELMPGQGQGRVGRSTTVNLVDDKAMRPRVMSHDAHAPPVNGPIARLQGQGQSNERHVDQGPLGEAATAYAAATVADSSASFSEMMGGPLLPDYDWTTFDPNSTDSWSSLGLAYEKRYGERPSAEIVMQMVMYQQMMMMMYAGAQTGGNGGEEEGYGM